MVLNKFSGWPPSLHLSTPLHFLTLVLWSSVVKLSAPQFPSSHSHFMPRPHEPALVSGTVTSTLPTRQSPLRLPFTHPSTMLCASVSPPSCHIHPPRFSPPSWSPHSAGLPNQQSVAGSSSSPLISPISTLCNAPRLCTQSPLVLSIS